MAACLIFIRTGRHILQIPKNVRQKNKASDFRWKERRVKRALFALRGRMIVYLDLQVWIARLEEKKKQREREKKQRLPTTIMRCEQITQMETDAHLSGENSIHIVTRFCRSVQMQHCFNMRLLLIFFFYWNFLLTRMTASVASTHHAHVPTHSTRSWRWRERDRHTLHSSTGISSI